jgi:peptidoglycan/LPS O-acetylase OafA/YrhL
MRSRSEPTFRADVQGLRALAVLIVVVYHTGLAIPGGYLGVDVFFVISGFVITNSILRRWEAGKGFSPIDFIGRRIRRLLPALAVMTMVCLPLTMWFTTFDGRQQGIATSRAASTFWSNVQLMLFRPNGYFVSSEKANPFLHTWSLSLEEQIYLVFPFLLVSLLLISRRLGESARRIAVVVFLVTLGVISFRLSIIGSLALDAWPVNRFTYLPENADFGRQLAFYSPVTRLWEFLAGALLALLPLVKSRLVSVVLAAAGLLMIVVTALKVDSQLAFPGWIALLPVSGTCLLILSSGGPLRKILSSRILGWFGDRSYSWYLWHWPVIVFASATMPGSSLAVMVAASGSLAIAAASFRFIEHPIREGNFWRVKSWRPYALGALCVGLPLLVSSVVVFEPTPELATHEDVEFECVVAEFSVLLTDENCFWPVDGARGDAVLIGDSQAGQLSGAFIRASHQNFLNARILTRTGAFFQNTPDRDQLARLIIENVKPQIVVLGQLTISWDSTTWAQQIRDYAQRFSDAGIGVVVPHRIRKGGEPLKCTPIRFSVFENTCELGIEDSTQSRADVKEIIALERLALADVERVHLFDPNGILCPEEPCKSRQEGKWIWRDGGHISREGARRLTPQLTEAIGLLLTNFGAHTGS